MESGSGRRTVLFLREMHRVVGREEARFAAVFREQWLPALAEDDDTRLLWYLEQSHGGGPSYRVVTIVAARDGATYERLAHRVRDGDLQALARTTDEYRHDVRGSVLRPLAWSPLEVDLADVPTAPTDHAPGMYLEDTMWPHRGRLDDYVEVAGDVYRSYIEADDERTWLRIHGAFQSVAGGGVHPQVVLLQRVSDTRRLVKMIASELPPEHRAPGTWMHDALEYRDRWRSRILRSATWSPLE